jgi:hypothetical protein
VELALERPEEGHAGEGHRVGQERVAGKTQAQGQTNTVRKEDLTKIKFELT